MAGCSEPHCQTTTTLIGLHPVEHSSSSFTDPSKQRPLMNLSRVHHPNRVCSEVPGGKGEATHLIGGLLTILTLPIVTTDADEDLPARRGRRRNAESTKYAGSGVPIPPRGLEAGHPPETVESGAWLLSG
jgi:hypothetical protein